MGSNPVRVTKRNERWLAIVFFIGRPCDIIKKTVRHLTIIGGHHETQEKGIEDIDGDRHRLSGRRQWSPRPP